MHEDCRASEVPLPLMTEMKLLLPHPSATTQARQRCIDNQMIMGECHKANPLTRDPYTCVALKRCMRVKSSKTSNLLRAAARHFAYADACNAEHFCTSTFAGRLSSSHHHSTSPRRSRYSTKTPREASLLSSEIVPMHVTVD